VLECMCILDSFAICTCLCLILCSNVGLLSVERCTENHFSSNGSDLIKKILIYCYMHCTLTSLHDRV